MIRLILVLALWFPFIVNATTYYVKNGGVDPSGCAGGTSDATAWASISKVNSCVTGTGDDVYFKEANTWSGTQLVIDWPGTSGNRSIVGAYHIVSGVETPGLSVGGLKPEIKGGFEYNSAVRGSVPASAYSGLVEMNADYVTVQNLNIINSSGYGIVVGGIKGVDFESRLGTDVSFSGSTITASSGLGNFDNNPSVYVYGSANGNDGYYTVSAATATTITISGATFTAETAGAQVLLQEDGTGNDYAIIENNTVEHSIGKAFIANTGADWGIYRNNYNFNLGWFEIQNVSPRPYVSHPGCIVLANAHNWLVEGNINNNSKCEQSAVINRAHDNIIRNNKFFQGEYAGGYADNAFNTLWENNLVVGGFTYSNGYVSSIVGFSSTMEGEDQYPHSAENNIFRNNILLGVKECFASDLWTVHPINMYRTSGQFIGNTCIARGTDSVLRINSNSNYPKEWEVANNIFINNNGAATCTATEISTEVNFHDNLWNVAQSDTQCTGAGDIAGSPSLTGESALLNWRNYTYDNQPAITLFVPASGSSVANVGDDLDANISFWNSLSQYSLSQTNSTCPVQQQELVTDYNCSARHATTPDLGALEIDGVALPSNVTLPYRQNMGNDGQVVVSEGTFVAQAFTSPCILGGYYKNLTDDILGTTDDDIYQGIMGCNGPINIDVPTGNVAVDVTLYLTESHWDFANRFYTVVVEGQEKYKNFDIFTAAVGKLRKYDLKISNVAVTDGKLNILLSKGSVGGTTDGKPEISAIKITTAVGSTLSVVNSAPSVTISNQYPAEVNINPIDICGVTSASGSVSLDSINSAGITSGVLTVDESIAYMPASAVSAGSVGSFIATFSDSSSTVTCEIGLVLQSIPYVTFTVLGKNGALLPNTQGWCWEFYTPAGKHNQFTTVHRNVSECDVSANGDSVIKIADPRFVRGEKVDVYVSNKNTLTYQPPGMGLSGPKPFGETHYHASNLIVQ